MKRIFIILAIISFVSCTVSVEKKQVNNQEAAVVEVEETEGQVEAPQEVVVVNEVEPIEELVRTEFEKQEIKVLQEKLNQLGYNSGSIDGILGTITYGAIAEFMADNGLSSEYKLDSIVYDAIISF